MEETSLTIGIEASMIATMSKVRLVAEIDEELRDALRLESALSGEGMAGIIERLIRDNFPGAVQQIRERRSRAENIKENRKGRPPKKNGGDPHA